MMPRTRLLVLIPARNEARTISHVVAGCRDQGATVWVLDDASEDATASLARVAGAEVKRYGSSALGKTAILRAALDELHRRSDLDPYQWLATMDGDGQHDPADLPRFVSQLQSADMVVGNRLNDARQMPFLRRWTNRGMSALLAWLYGGKVTDTQCGFRLIRRSALGLWLPRGRRFEFETEIHVAARTRRWRVQQVPIAAIYRDEQSGIFWPVDALRFARCLW